MDAQDRTDGVCELRSPLRKLVRFFQRSRDQWKRKAQERKQACERMGNQVRAVTASRDKWRTLALSQRRQLKRLEAGRAKKADQDA